MDKLKTLLPPNASPPEIALESTHAERIEAIPVPIKQIRRPLLTPRVFIPWLAWDNGVTWWEDSWTEFQKRQVVKSAPEINKRRGTIGAIKRALASVDYLTEVIEWYQETPKAQPYTFKVILYGSGISEEILEKLVNQINDAKNVRSHLSEIGIAPQAIEGKFYMGGAVVATITARIGIKSI
ncbi:tail protein I [Buttiauxella ferragutiae ATCC 51602]|uniref:Tail protein I n=1 Tax=Buttiauxella ferragutiae ATCC 51602 TaxID=1354252 RepID=A0ABX2W7C9_9ENTR|nr:phage tail protein I [Buttiauxella ferragutiae]OAT26728.1 tail protein I [Buttiauxella ferragutiae ATCC 51602]